MIPPMKQFRLDILTETFGHALRVDDHPAFQLEYQAATGPGDARE
jgi:hypothetical protein